MFGARSEKWTHFLFVYKQLLKILKFCWAIFARPMSLRALLSFTLVRFSEPIFMSEQYNAGVKKRPGWEKVH